MTPIPPRPAGVDIAAIVSFSRIFQKETLAAATAISSAPAAGAPASTRTSVSSWATPAVTSAKSAAASIAIARPAWTLGPRTGRTNRLWKGLHVRGHNHHLPNRPLADALAAYFGLAP